MKKIDRLIREWFYLHPAGYANKPYSQNDLKILESAMVALDFNYNEIESVLKKLFEKIDPDKTIKYKDSDGQSKEMPFSSAVKLKKDHPARIEAEKLKSKDTPGQDSGQEPVKGASLFKTVEPGSSAAKDIDKKKKSQPPSPEQLSKNLKQTLSPEVRITNPEVQAEMKADDSEEQQRLNELSKLKNQIKMEGDFKQKSSTLVAIGHLYGKRSNSGFGKNLIGEVDRDQLNLNKDNLIEGYDDAKPELVEKYVRGVRKHKVTEDFVNKSYDSLPSSLKSALNGKGKVGDREIGPVGGHFLGYRKNDGSTTTDFSDSDIAKDSDGNPVIIRGNVGNTSRGKLVWRIYLEQGGIDAYTGLPLNLESMDLEHVVGFKNSDKGEPTTKDYGDREHEANHVLTSSKANQNKSDMSMKEFFEKQVDPLADKTPEEFGKLEKGIEKANQITPRTEQTALRLMDDPEFKLKGGGTTKDPNDPNIQTTDLGTPRVEDANLSKNITPNSLQQEFDYEEEEYNTLRASLLKDITDPADVKKIKRLNTKIGKRTINALGLPAGIPDPSGRRTNAISGSDNFYRGFLLSMAEAKPEDRGKFKECWRLATKIASSQEVRSQGRTSQSQKFLKHLRDNKCISESVLNDKRYSKLFRYKNEKGEII
tara:strand:- start:13389 stop:15338 length:1950 start_codon:yes stop_codon:yes gene_type:complete